MRGEIKRLQKRLGATTLYVTHDQAEATTMADLVAVMRDGVLQQLAPPLEIYDRPANRFVATFVGGPPMNVLPGSVDGDRRAFAAGEGAIPLAEPVFTRVAAAGATAIGVRPEDFSLSEPSSDTVLRGEVYVVEPLGNETLVEVRAERGWDAPIGSPVGLRLDPLAACFFDADGDTVVQRSDQRDGRELDMTTAGSGQGNTTERSLA
jgi:multiple sugar transport system ATP-binding protein